MKKIFLIIILISCIGSFYFLRKNNSQKLDEVFLIGRYRAIFDTVSDAFCERLAVNSQSELKLVVFSLVNEKSKSFFQSKDGRLWVYINPDAESWRQVCQGIQKSNLLKNKEAVESIAIYCPKEFLNSEHNRCFIGWTFLGEIVEFQKKPNWKPIPIWEASK